MAEQLVVHDSVTHVPTLGEYQMDKEKDVAFRKLVRRLPMWCARNGRLTHEDRCARALGEIEQGQARSLS